LSGEPPFCMRATNFALAAPVLVSIAGGELLAAMRRSHRVMRRARWVIDLEDFRLARLQGSAELVDKGSGERQVPLCDAFIVGIFARAGDGGFGHLLAEAPMVASVGHCIRKQSP